MFLAELRPALRRTAAAGGDTRQLARKCQQIGVAEVTKSVLDAIREGDWFFEPPPVEPNRFSATEAIPGTREKLAVLAARARAGLPLWHDQDRTDYEERDR